MAWTSYGGCRGLQQKGCVSFKGIRYAAPPVRFSRPLPPEPWSGVRDCLRHGRAAVQPSFDYRALAKLAAKRALNARLPLSVNVQEGASEDCLYLNITTPSLKGKAPVLFYIHGGAFQVGSGSQPLYRGAPLCRTEKVVVVTMNYRLGCFGFMHVPGGDKNCGVWDLLQALRWVHSEIASFGGDPENITISGQSAGGMLCGTLLTSPLAQPYFRRAILMSGFLSNIMTAHDAEQAGHTFCHFAGAREDTAEVLRELSTEVLVNAMESMPGVMPYQPCVDGELIPMMPLEALESGSLSLAGKDVLLGTTAQEWNFFSLPGYMRPGTRLDHIVGEASKVVSRQRPSRTGVDESEFDREMRETFKMMRAEGGHKNWAEVRREFYSMVVFLKPARVAAEALARTAARVFMYSYNFDAGRMGAAHATELFLLFGVHGAADNLTKQLSGSAAEPEATAELSRTMMRCFGSFTRIGAPTGSVAPGDTGSAPCPWPVFNDTDGGHNIFIFDRVCRLEHEPKDSPLGRLIHLTRDARRPFGVHDFERFRSRL